MNEGHRKLEELREEDEPTGISATVEPAASKQVLDLRAREAESVPAELRKESVAPPLLPEEPKDLLRARWDVYSMGLRMRRARQ